MIKIKYSRAKSWLLCQPYLLSPRPLSPRFGDKLNQNLTWKENFSFDWPALRPKHRWNPTSYGCKESLGGAAPSNILVILSNFKKIKTTSVRSHTEKLWPLKILIYNQILNVGRFCSQTLSRPTWSNQNSPPWIYGLLGSFCLKSNSIA